MKTLPPTAVLLLALATPAAAAPPSYTRDVRPFLDKYCVTCHRPGKLKAKVDLTDYSALFKKSKKGRPVVVPGKPDASHLQRTLEGHKPVMPPKKDKQPTAKEVAMVRAWIAAGAKDDSARSDAPPDADRPRLPRR